MAMAVKGKIPRPPFVPWEVATHGVSDFRHFIFHTTEGADDVEGLEAFFHRQGLGYGVTYFIDSRGRMCTNGVPAKITWHVKLHNTECRGCELGGTHLRTQRDWYLHLTQLHAITWLAAWVSQQYDIPLRRSMKNRQVIHPSGFAGHLDVPDNDHTDPGVNFPWGWVFFSAARWQREGIPAWVQSEVIKARRDVIK